MERYLVPKEEISSPSASVRTAAAVQTSSSLDRGGSKRPTAVAESTHPATKKHTPSALERLRCEEQSGRKIGLSPALKDELLRGPTSKKRPAALVQRRNTENSTPTTQEAAPASKRRSWQKNVAAMATAQEAGWNDIPNDNKASPAPAASAAVTQRVAAGAPSLLPRTEVAPPTQTLPPATTGSDSLPEERRPEAERRRAVPKVIGSRAGRMDGYFPPRVVSPSASPPPVVPARHSSPSSLPHGWASQYARPTKVRRYARRRSRDYGDSGCEDEDSVDSEGEGGGCDYDGGDGQPSRDPNADHHLRWRGVSDEKEEEEEEQRGQGGGGRAQVVDGSSARGLSTGEGADRWSGVEPATRSAPEAAGSVSAGHPASAGEAARSTARSEAAARAAAAAEKRRAAVGRGEGPARMEVESDNGDQVAVSGAAAPAPAASDASTGGPQVPEETEALAEGANAAAEAAEEAPAFFSFEENNRAAAAAVAWPCRRKHGAASLFLSQRQRTGGLLRRGVAAGDAGRDTFRRQALSAVFANGLKTQRLRLGRTSNSHTAAGVVRGHPESQGGVQGLVAGGVTCMEFDSEGWHLAVAGENVTVYDFDSYLPEVCFCCCGCCIGRTTDGKVGLRIVLPASGVRLSGGVALLSRSVLAGKGDFRPDIWSSASAFPALSGDSCRGLVGPALLSDLSKISLSGLLLLRVVIQ